MGGGEGGKDAKSIGPGVPPEVLREVGDKGLPLRRVQLLHPGNKRARQTASREATYPGVWKPLKRPDVSATLTTTTSAAAPLGSGRLDHEVQSTVNKRFRAP